MPSFKQVLQRTHSTTTELQLLYSCLLLLYYCLGAGAKTLKAVLREGENLLGGGEDFNIDVAPPPAASRTQTQKKSVAAPREGDELLGGDTTGALRTPKRKKKVTEQLKASKASSEQDTPLANPGKTPANLDLEQLAVLYVSAYCYICVRRRCQYVRRAATKPVLCSRTKLLNCSRTKLLYCAAQLEVPQPSN